MSHQTWESQLSSSARGTWPPRAHGWSSFLAMVSTAGNESWLRDEVFLTETRSQVFFQSLKAWWRETTDILILNSPLLNRATGNAFRCITLCSQSFLACEQHGYFLKIHEDKPGFVYVGTVILIIGSIASFLATVWRQRESVRSSWFYCFVLAVSLQLLTTSQVHNDETRFLYISAVLCHCNIHPIPLLLVMGPMLYDLYYATINLGGSFMGSFATIDSVWCTSMLLLLFCAFTHDFTVRVKAISTGMILPHQGGQAHDSPLSGRSGRSICWLMVLSIWLAWVALIIGKASHKTRAGHYEHVFENRLPICTWLVPLVLFASILALRVSGNRSGRCALWQADLTMFICSCTPPLMIFVDLMLLAGFGNDKPEPVRIEFEAQFQTRAQSMLFIAGQLLVQAGCHPIVCTGPCVVLGLQVLAAFSINAFLVRPLYFPLDEEEIAKTLAWSSIVWISHTVDYVTRYRAVREGLERARDNAASTQSLLDSINRPCVELQRMLPLEAAARTTITCQASVAVAVVRHAERADGAHAYDDWGCSEDGNLCCMHFFQPQIHKY